MELQKPGQPPTQDEAAFRAVCLGALVERSRLDRVSEALPEPVRAAIYPRTIVRLNDWIEASGLREWQSSVECELFRRKPGSWTTQELINAHWRGEALSMLLWALGVLEAVPPYDVHFNEAEVLRLVGVYGPVNHFIARAAMRPAVEIAHARDLAESWHWRANTTILMRDKPDYRLPNGLTFARIIEWHARECYKLGEIPAPIDGDFPAMGKAFAALDSDEFSLMNSISRERQYAFNWLCGYHEDWDKVRTDT